MGGERKSRNMKQQSHEGNDMAFQPMKYIQDMITTYTRDIALETRQFSEFPTSKLEGRWVIWS